MLLKVDLIDSLLNNKVHYTDQSCDFITRRLNLVLIPLISLNAFEQVETNRNLPHIAEYLLTLCRLLK